MQGRTRLINTELQPWCQEDNRGASTDDGSKAITQLQTVSALLEYQPSDARAHGFFEKQM